MKEKIPKENIEDGNDLGATIPNFGENTRTYYDVLKEEAMPEKFPLEVLATDKRNESKGGKDQITPSN